MPDPGGPGGACSGRGSPGPHLEAQAYTQGGSPGKHNIHPVTATAAAGTHPTGMHSCYFMREIILDQYVCQICSSSRPDCDQ